MGCIINASDQPRAVAKCANCPMKGKAIGSKGPIDSPFVIVGESPGARELAAGLPFVGPSGKMLEETLSDVFFEKTGVRPYITNALQCLPKEKNVPNMKTYTDACRGRLLEELKAYPRDVILTLGAAAAWAVTGNFDIKVTLDRGRIFNSPLATKGVVVTVHPAFMMRPGGASYYTLWKKDLGDATKLFTGEFIPGNWVPPTWDVAEDRDDFIRIINTYRYKKLITGDVETDALQAHDGRMLMLGITADTGQHVDIIPEQLLYDNWDLTTELVEMEGIKWNWHNGKFDIRWFIRHGANARVDEDTMMLSYSENENKGRHDLDQVALREIRAPAHKSVLDQYLPNKKASYRVIPSAVLHEYAAYDISKTHQQWAPMKEKNEKDKHLSKLYKHILIPASNLLPRVEDYGVLVDRDRIQANEERLTLELAKAEEPIQEYALKHEGKRILLTSWQQVQHLLYDKMRLGPLGSSTDEKALIKIRRTHGHPIVEHMLRFREIAKLKGTYVSNLPPLICSDGRIRTSFKIHGTTTGRLAANVPNLLNQPRVPEIRGQYVAAPGKIFIEVDLNQAELRSLALMSGDPLLTEIYTKNEISIHDVTTGKFFGTKEELKTNAAKLALAQKQLFLPPDATPDFVYKEAKMRGKAVNFGVVYGREAFSLAEEFDIPVAEAQRWIDAWFETYPGAKAFIERCRLAPQNQKTLITNFGRKKRWGVVAPENLTGFQNEAANFPHQSTASDIMLVTAIEVHQPLINRWGAYMWNELYDAIYLEIDEDDRKIAEAIAYVQEVITRVPKDWGLTRIPFMGDAKVGYDWGHMKDWEGSIDKSLEGLAPEFRRAA